MLDGDTLRAYLIMWWLHIYYSIYHGAILRAETSRADAQPMADEP